MINPRGILFCLVGPAASGKSTIASRLLQEFSTSMKLSISVTSRQKRPSEVEGESYNFVSEKEFETKIGAKEFFEWEKVHGHYYGTPAKTIEQALQGCYDLLLDIDIKGAFSFRKHFPESAIVIFLVPPSSQVMRERIEARSKVSSEELARRLSTAQQEYDTLIKAVEGGGGIDYLVVNDALEETYSNVKGIVLAERSRIKRLHPEDVKKLCAGSC